MHSGEQDVTLTDSPLRLFKSSLWLREVIVNCVILEKRVISHSEYNYSQNLQNRGYLRNL